MNISNINSAPRVESFSPENGIPSNIRLDSNQTFSVLVSDPDNDPLDLEWLIDGKKANNSDSSTVNNNNFTFIYDPKLENNNVGFHLIQANITDNNPLGGTITKNWFLAVLAPDADGDGWTANVDCDDNNVNVNPAR